VESKSKKLRSGYTTGACAAAAAKAATRLLLLNAERGLRKEAIIETVEIPFPDGSRVSFSVHHAGLRTEKSRRISTASVIKDAGDDPDITDGAEIRAEVSYSMERGTTSAEQTEIHIQGGLGVGRVTKPGLAIPVGQPAINPVPRRMIQEAVREAVSECGSQIPLLDVSISVPAGEKLAEKTLNHRLGIVGGISILGTTGIVRPLSEAAWTATITASFDVAKALGLNEVVISTGRTSEKAHQRKYGLPVEAYAMIGDYTEFSLRNAKKHGFLRIHLCAQWAKMIKIAMAIPQTHVRHGALEAKVARDFLVRLGIDVPRQKVYNTSREIYDHILSAYSDPRAALNTVCVAARKYCEQVTGGIPVAVHLVSYEGYIVEKSE
jgi:cobalt-precorrin-5B (C1)-methyltransferase